MRLVEWTDESGLKHLAYIKDNDPESLAPKGLSADPPDIGRLDWDAIKKEIHNQMVEQRLITWDDVQKKQNALAGIVLGTVRKQLVALYRSLEEDG